MRCPKCGYISFDRVTSCAKCDTDVAELASSLNGTGFQPMNNFFLGTLLPDFIKVVDSETSGLQDAADDLNISMDDLSDLGEIGDIPGESDGLDLGLGDIENESTISLQGVVVPEVDLSDFDDGELDNIDTMQISADQLDEAQSQSDDEQIDLGDVDLPDFDLEGVDLGEEGEVGADVEADDVSFSDEEVMDVAESVEDMPSLDLEMESDVAIEDDQTEMLSVGDIDLSEDEGVEQTATLDIGDDLDVAEEVEDATAALDLGDIDLSLGDDESDDGDDMALADLDLGDLEMESDADTDDLPDLKL